jgi:hypothetical protein
MTIFLALPLRLVYTVTMATEKPMTLRELRRAVTDYYKNPQKYIDPASFEHSRREIYQVRLRPLHKVLGIERLGGGAYADVYALDEHRVLKIVRKTDEGYKRFIRKSKNKSVSGNPYLPVVHFRGKWGGKEVYILERLESGEGRDDTYAFIRAVSFLQENEENPFFEVKADPCLLEVVDVLANSDCLNDLHDGNVMWRGDQPVITDPCT